jgi:hypothetical protein
LRGLLHYLWDQAELTRWHPGFAGKRTWATVRRHLLQAAEHKLARGDSLRARLYVPEPFSIDERDAINARRLAQWQHAVAAPGKPQHLMLLIGEVKEIVPARYGFKAVVKHMPDQAFAIDEQLYRRLGRRFEPELALWGASDDIHMVMIATFGVSSAGVPAIVELSLMPVTRHWLPGRGRVREAAPGQARRREPRVREGPALQPRAGQRDRERRAHRLRRVGADAVHRSRGPRRNGRRVTRPATLVPDGLDVASIWRADATFPAGAHPIAQADGAAHGERTPQPASAERP